MWVDLAFQGREAWTRDGATVASGVWREIADLVSIETITGSDFADDLRGDGNANRLTGGSGDDVLNGRGGSDIIDGGAGVDTAVFANALAGYAVSLVGSDIVVTGEGTDTVRDTVEQFRFGSVTFTRALLLAAIAPRAVLASAPGRP